MSVRSGSIVLPEWQDDSEVSECHICKRRFRFLFRKHHCRRCGRIICDQCSPHRITIPRQYIVRPPWDVISYRIETDEAGNEYFNPALGGGETVRVCNPCVPDPNYGPPPQHLEPALSRAHINGASTTDLPTPDDEDGQRRSATYHGGRRSPERTHPRPYFHQVVSEGPPIPEVPEPRFRPRNTHTASPGSPVSGRPRHRQNSSSVGNVLTNALPIPPPTLAPRRSSHHASGSAPPAYALLPDRTIIGTRNVPSPRHGRVFTHRRPAAGPIREEDECPVCGTHAPPFGPNSDQAAREQHIEACINSHLQFSSTPRSASNLPSNSPPRSVPTEAPPPPAKPTQRMLVYQATEKDCHDETGNVAECVICLDEFEPGQEVGRLECLCKFHRTCIRGWWESGPKARERWGTCPTHALHM